ncbi:hypothetical protein K0C01_01685 [Salinarchaeum sp. IM2453]|uniref:hypothetical protein n=1 Tax=Salinarchaeum sp. IM2453 TaxID=2862870 RepID=UPI001C82F685|nr:hypothetical protein [Salinarchaeum sp. IM2453]QZA88904.1 hypothetical protein K0C01_01685 [Salinarchaeum sp. IM2453]
MALNPHRVDIAVDFAYGVLIFIAIVLMLQVGTTAGIAFGIGVFLSYLLHVGWKMARFDPDWMTQEVAESVEETVAEEVDEVIDRVEEVNERVDRRPKTEEIEETVEKIAEGQKDQ